MVARSFLRYIFFSRIGWIGQCSANSFGEKSYIEACCSSQWSCNYWLWHFNEKYGLWIQAGAAAKTGDCYTAEVNHFSTWNLDLECTNFKLDLQFKDPLGNALTGLIADVTALQNLNNLQVLWLQNNKISNIGPLTNGVSNLISLLISSQQQGAITQVQQDAFKSNHPGCAVAW
jgi:hypothetical protein